MAGVTVATVLRLSDDSTVPIVIRPAHDGSDEWVAVYIAGMLPEHWQYGTMRRLAGTRRSTPEQQREYKQRRRARAIID